MLSGKIKQIWEKSSRTYGCPRVWEELRKAEGKVSRSLTARVMRKHGIHSVHRKKFKVTTDSKHSHPVSENVLNRDFLTDRIAQKWVSDLTYIHTKEGWLYLTVVIDLFDRKVLDGLLAAEGPHKKP